MVLQISLKISIYGKITTQFLDIKNRSYITLCKEHNLGPFTLRIDQHRQQILTQTVPT